jgi:hypothetical protein
MTTAQSERQVVAVPPHHLVFVHHWIVGVQQHGHRVQSLATCITPWPEPRCRCCLVDLQWAHRSSPPTREGDAR